MSFRFLACAVLIGAIVGLAPAAGHAHCQVPCGIYDDAARFTQLDEHFTTIEKAMAEIEALSKAKEPNYNQIVRWVTTKEEHAAHVVEILSEYFLMQRIAIPTAKAADSKAQKRYEAMLRLVHGMLVQTMKAKQTTDASHAAAARKLKQEFQDLYGAQ